MHLAVICINPFYYCLIHCCPLIVSFCPSVCSSSWHHLQQHRMPTQMQTLQILMHSGALLGHQVVSPPHPKPNSNPQIQVEQILFTGHTPESLSHKETGIENVHMVKQKQSIQMQHIVSYVFFQVISFWFCFNWFETYPLLPKMFHMCNIHSYSVKLERIQCTTFITSKSNRICQFIHFLGG